MDLEISRLKRVFSLAMQWEQCSRNPAKGIKLLREDDGRTRFLSEEEEQQLLYVCAPPLKRIVLCALNTGMRRGELLGLRHSQVRRDLGVAEIPGCVAKGRVLRPVYLNKVALEAIGKPSSQQERDALVFSNSEGQPQVNRERLWRKALKKSGIQGFRFHDLRHTFASRLAMRNISLDVIGRLLGHKSLEMAQRYSHFRQRHLNEVVALLGADFQNTSNNEESRLAAAW